MPVFVETTSHIVGGQKSCKTLSTPQSEDFKSLGISGHSRFCASAASLKGPLADSKIMLLSIVCSPYTPEP